MRKKGTQHVPVEKVAAGDTEKLVSRWGLSTRLELLIITLCIGVVYWNSLHGPFQFDDLRIIKFNFSLRDLTNWRDIFLSERYRPLLIGTFALNFALGKHDPFTYHLLNVLLHISAVVCFYFLLRRQTKGNEGPLNAKVVPIVAALLMAVHPLNTESVSYIASRSIELCAVFYFLALLSFDSYSREGNRYFAALFFVFFFLGATVKEEAAMIPVAALLYDFIFGGFQSVKKHRWIHAAALLILLAGGIFRISPLLKSGEGPYPYAIWLPTELYVWARYLYLALYPVSLNVDPDVPKLQWNRYEVWFAFAFITSVVVLLWRFRKKVPFVTFWGLWFFLNLVVSSATPLLDFMAEHRAYISTFGFCACAGALFALWNFKLKQRAVFITGLVLLLCVYSYMTIQRNRVWASTFALWYDAKQKSPRKLRPPLNLAGAYIDRGAYDLAIQEYLYVLTLKPDDAFAYSGLGICYMQKGNLVAAEKCFLRAHELNPSLIDPKTGLGMIAYSKGDYEKAIAYLQSTYSRRQESVRMVTVLADSFFRLKRYEEAIPYLQQGAKLEPREPAWNANLMVAYALLNRLKEANEVFNKMNGRLPGSPQLQLQVADVLIRIGRQQEAKRILLSLSKDPTVGEAAQQRLSKLQ